MKSIKAIETKIRLAMWATLLACSASLHAQELVVGLFGGSFVDDAKFCHIAAFEKKTGARVIIKLGNSAQFAAAIRATAGKSDMDVVTIDNSLAVQLRNENLLQTIDRSKLANVGDIAPQVWDAQEQYVVFMTGATAIVYDTTQIRTPPESWFDLLKPELAERVSIGDISGTSGLQFFLALNRISGGTYNNIDPGIKAIKPFVKASATLYTQADQILSLFERKEIAAAVWYPDRAGSAIDKGLPLAVVYPKEGGVGILPALAIPKGAKNTALALQFIDEVLSREGQTCFAEKKYAGPVNTQVTLSEKAAKIVPYRESFDNLWLPDPEAVSKGLPQWTRRWQREVLR